MKEKYTTIAHAERTVDVYGGESCEEHIAKWQTSFEGDMDHEESTTPLILAPESFPPGTKITIEAPVCPECDMDYDLCQSTDCDFDWKQWVEDKYS